MFNKYLESLNEQKLNYVGICLDMVWFGFGIDIERIDILTNQKEYVAKFSLHVQSSFYIYDKELKEELFSSEMLPMLSHQEQDANIYIENKFKAYCDTETIEFINITTENLLLQTERLIISIDNYSTSFESWRFFETETEKKHLVCRNGKIDLE